MNKCYYCEYTFGSPVSQKGVPLVKTRDHIIPASKGGNSSTFNIVFACHQCNHLKGDRLPYEFSDFLKSKVIQMQKGLGSYRNMTIQRIGIILKNNEQLIETISEYKEKLLKGYKFTPISKNKPTVKKRNEMKAQIKQKIITSIPYSNELSLKDFIEQWSKKPDKGYEPTLKEIANKVRLRNLENDRFKKSQTFIERYNAESQSNFHFSEVE